MPKLTDYSELTTPAAGDFIPIVDVSDSTQSAAGTLKKIQKANLGGVFTSIDSTGITVTQGAGTIVLDAGNTEVRIAQIGSVVIMVAYIVMGATTAGTTNSTITVVVDDAPAINLAPSAQAWGGGQIFSDETGLSYQVLGEVIGGPAPTIAFYRTDGTGDGSNYVGKDPNFALEQYDSIAFSITYEAG